MGRFKVKILHSYTFVYRITEKDHCVQIISPDISGGEIILIDKSQLAFLRQVRPLNDFKMLQFQKRLENGDICFCARIGGSLVSYMWVRGSNCPYYSSVSRRRHVVHADELWFFDVFTAPPYRGKRIVPWMYTTLINEYAHAIRNFYVDVFAGNLPSIRSIRRSGFLLYKTHYVISLGKFYIRIT